MSEPQIEPDHNKEMNRNSNTAPQIKPKTFLTTKKYYPHINFMMLMDQKDLIEIERKQPTYNMECRMQQLPQVIEELSSRPIV